MKNAVAEWETKDEIIEKCTQCGKERLIAYWDYELEYYIYLSESAHASHCKNCLAAGHTKVSDCEILEMAEEMADQI